MDEQRLNLWIKKILETEEDEISCSDCFDLLSSYVDGEESGYLIDPSMKRVAVHLKQCQACCDEYDMLREVTRSEAARQLPATHTLLNSILHNLSG